MIATTIAEGTDIRMYDKLGAHLMEIDGYHGVRFAVWAPSALRVSVVGDFNMWDGRRHVMRYHPVAGCGEIFIPGLGEGRCTNTRSNALYGLHLQTKVIP